MEKCNKRSEGGNNRFVGLDLLRIMLALLIYMFHSRIHLGCNYYYLNGVVSVGAVAMTGFMLLSGFVLYVTYSKVNLCSLSNIKIFYYKRLISILPLYYFVAFIHVVYQLSKGLISLSDTAALFPLELFAGQSTLYGLFPYSHNDGTWFVSCILIAYALYPYLQTLLTQMSTKWRVILLLFAVGMLLYAPLVRIYFNLGPQTIYSNPIYRLLEFLIGIILACKLKQNHYGNFGRLFLNPIFLIITIILMLLSITLVTHIYPTNDYMLFNWIVLPCFIVIIINLTSTFNKNNQESKVISYLSSLSFTFFMCQVLPLWDVSKIICALIGNDSNWVKILISFIVCCLGAVFIHEVIEKNTSKYLKNKLNIV